MNIEAFDYSVNLLQSILWQYDKAPNLISLMAFKQTWYDINQQGFWSNWYEDVFNLTTANAFGLSVWAIILDVPLYLNISPDIDQPVFGFNTVPSENTNQNFTRGNFSSRGSAQILSEEEQRLVLRLRYFQLITRGAIPEINQFLNYLFNSSGSDLLGQVWALDGLHMNMRYVFNFNIPRGLLSILRQLRLLPKPAGVRLQYYVNQGGVFGFGSFNKNFGNGNFIPESFFGD